MSKSLHFSMVVLFFYSIIINSGGAYAQGKRDPFVSIGDKMLLNKGAIEVVHLPYPVIISGTMCSKGVRLAVINGDIVREGGKWRDFIISKIERNKVILKWRGKKFQVKTNFAEEKNKK